MDNIRNIELRNQYQQFYVSYLAVGLYVLAKFTMAFDIFDIYTIVPYTVVMLIMVFFCIVRGKVQLPHIRMIAVMLIYDCIVTVFNHGGVGSVLIQIYAVITIILYSNCILNNSMIRLIMVSDFIIWIYWFLRSNNYYEIALNANYINVKNSNTVAELLLFCFMSLCLLNDYQNRKFRKRSNRMLEWLFFLATFWAVYQCGSRTTLVAAIFFVLLHKIIPQNIWTRKRIVIATLLLLLGALLFPFLYLALSGNHSINYLVYRWTGRYMFTGRERIWKALFNGFAGSRRRWLFGVGSHSMIGVETEFTTNFHNVFLVIMFNFGLIGVALFGLFICRYIHSLFDERQIDMFKLECVFVFWVVILINYAETIMLWHPMIPLCYFYLAIARNMNDW